jgi:molybdopterin synthase sulfur carrier subunit
MTGVRTETVVTVRYFAAARAAAGIEDETVTVPAGTSVATLIGLLGAKSTEMAHVLQRCSYLCDGIAVRDAGMPLGTDPTLDVLPPFAGG